MDISSYIDLPINKYDVNEKYYISYIISDILYDIKLYAHLTINQNHEVYQKIIGLLSDGKNLIECHLTELNDKIDNNNNLTINKKILFGDIQSMKDITIHNNFVNIQLNNNDEFVSIYETDYVNNNYHTMTCLLTILFRI